MEVRCFLLVQMDLLVLALDMLHFVAELGSLGGDTSVNLLCCTWSDLILIYHVSLLMAHLFTVIMLEGLGLHGQHMGAVLNLDGFRVGNGLDSEVEVVCPIVSSCLRQL